MKNAVITTSATQEAKLFWQRVYMASVDWTTSSSVADSGETMPIGYYFCKLMAYAPMETAAYKSIIKLLQLARDMGGHNRCEWILLVELGDLDSLNIETIKMAHSCPIFRQLRDYIWRVEIMDPGMTTVGTTRNGPILRSTRMMLVYVNSNFEPGARNAIEDCTTVVWTPYSSDGSRLDYIFVDVEEKMSTQQHKSWRPWPMTAQGSGSKALK